MRAIWTGEIAFGLVAIPVKLYSAVRDLAPHFHYIHKKCGTRIETVRRCPHCDVDVPWEDIQKGFEVSKGKYAKFTKEEIAELGEEEEASGIDIVEFLDPGLVDLAFIEKSYWVGPAGKSTRGYELLRDALEKVEKVAIAKVKIRTRTRVAMLRPRDGRFSLDMMRFGDELVDGKEVEVPRTTKHATPKELDLALGLVKQLTAKTFDPSKHPDDYRAAVAKAVEKKVEDEEVTEEEDQTHRPANSNARGRVVDLADILQRSLGAAKHPPKKTKKHAATTKRARPAAAKHARKPRSKRHAA